jgi:multidrug resistance efflux pump
MPWLRKMRVLFFVVGVALCVATLIGARQLTGGSPSDGRDAAPHARGGPVVMGTVDTDPQPVQYGLPPVLQSGTIAHVFVKRGEEVKAGQPLYAFDDTIQKADLKLAKAAVEYAKTKVKEAEELANQHAEQVKVMEQAVEAARTKEQQTATYYRIVEKDLETYYEKVEKKPQSEWPELKKTNATLFKAQVDYNSARLEWKGKEAELKRLKAVNPQVKVQEAEAAVKQAEAQQAKAQDAVDLCVMKAQMPGTVEQVTIGQGSTLGISTRSPALWLVPTGPRVVRAEVEAEFAHRVGPDLKGRAVTIADHSDPKLTYTGTVLDISDTFLLKRASAENFLNGDTRVIEVVVEVKDPAPAGKPPLRVGQRVRVNLGQ